MNRSHKDFVLVQYFLQCWEKNTHHIYVYIYIYLQSSFSLLVACLTNLFLFLLSTLEGHADLCNVSVVPYFLQLLMMVWTVFHSKFTTLDILLYSFLFQSLTETETAMQEEQTLVPRQARGSSCSPLSRKMLIILSVYSCCLLVLLGLCQRLRWCCCGCVNLVVVFHVDSSIYNFPVVTA